MLWLSWLWALSPRGHQVTLCLRLQGAPENFWESEGPLPWPGSAWGCFQKGVSLLPHLCTGDGAGHWAMAPGQRVPAVKHSPASLREHQSQAAEACIPVGSVPGLTPLPKGAENNSFGLKE